MNKIDTDNIKHSHNIVDIIEKYVPLKNKVKTGSVAALFTLKNRLRLVLMKRISFIIVLAAVKMETLLNLFKNLAA